MTNAPEDDAMAWQDLSAELATEDVEQLEATAVERLAHGEPDALVAEALLADARELADRKTADTKFHDIAQPAGAAEVGAWQSEHNDGDRWERTFVGTIRIVQQPESGMLEIKIVGFQSEHGDVQREVVVTTDSTDTHLDAPSTREFSRALGEAANEVERLETIDTSQRSGEA